MTNLDDEVEDGKEEGVGRILHLVLVKDVGVGAELSVFGAFLQRERPVEKLPHLRNRICIEGRFRPAE